MDRAVVEAIHVAPGILGLVHGQIGVAQQHHRLGAVVRIDRDADARRCDEFAFADDEGRRERGNDLLRNGRGLVAAIQVACHNQEFVPAQPRHDVVAAHRLHETLRHLPQQAVADGMSQRVVDFLEMIEIDEHCRDLAAVASRTADRLYQAVVRQHAVGQAGEQVVVRLIGYLLHLLALFGDVLARQQQMGRLTLFVTHDTQAQAFPINIVAAPAGLLDLPDGAADRHLQCVVGIERIGRMQHIEQRTPDQFRDRPAGDALVGRVGELDRTANARNQDTHGVLFDHLREAYQAAIRTLEVGGAFLDAHLEFDLRVVQSVFARQHLPPHDFEYLRQIPDFVVAGDRDLSAFLAGRQLLRVFAQDADAVHHGPPGIGQAGEDQHAAERHQPEEMRALPGLFLDGHPVGVGGVGFSPFGHRRQHGLDRQKWNVRSRRRDAPHAGEIHFGCQSDLFVQARTVVAPVAGKARRLDRRRLAQQCRKLVDLDVHGRDFATQACHLGLQREHILQMPQFEFQVAQGAEPRLQGLQAGQRTDVLFQSGDQALRGSFQHQVAGDQQYRHQSPHGGKTGEQLRQETEAQLFHEILWPSTLRQARRRRNRHRRS